MDNAQKPRPSLQLPRVNPVGLVEYAEGSNHGPRPIRGAQRVAVWCLLIFFAVAALGTSILSLGAYCLTSDGADTRALHETLVATRTNASESSERPRDLLTTREESSQDGSPGFDPGP